MDGLLAFQTWVLKLSPGLFPLLGLVYSIMSVPHCALMCSPMFARSAQSRSVLLGRGLGYTLTGAALGG
jgi:hypothetical protein